MFPVHSFALLDVMKRAGVEHMLEVGDGLSVGGVCVLTASLRSSTIVH